MELGLQITADHITTLSDKDESLEGFVVALVIFDRGTQWLVSYPRASRTREETLAAFQHLTSPDDKVESFCSDDAPELISAAEDMGWRHALATPHRRQTNGVIGRAVRKVLDGTRSVLCQAGLASRWWAKAMPHFCFAHNITQVT